MSNEQNVPQSGDPRQHNDENVDENKNVEYTAFSDDIDPIEKPPKSDDQLRIAILEDELANTKDHMMRAVAEAENGRKRALKEREDASKYAVSNLSRDLLSVADNLRRAIDAAPSELLEQDPQIKNLFDGIEATERELLRSFAKHGIQKTEPLGEKFDPNFHEVMFETPMPDKQAGEIIQVIESGYILNGRILRPARVGIAKNDGAPSLQEGSSSEAGSHIDTKA